MAQSLGSLPIVVEQDVVAARQRARDLARALGFESQDQARVATAVSEIARNALRYARGGTCDFSVEGERPPQILIIRIADRGGGIANLDTVLGGQYRSRTGMGIGLVGAQRLMDQCDIATGPQGTTVVLKKILPSRARALSNAELDGVRARLERGATGSPMDELAQQHRDLLNALAELKERQEELLRLNRELEDTNRGVVALYAELDEKADHLRRADEMKTSFLSNMSHEFRTPLNSIRALSGILLDRVDGPLTEEQETQVGYVRKAAEDLTELVEDLLDIAKIEAGKTEVSATAVDIPKLFSALRGMLRPLLVTESVKLRFDIPDDLPILHTDEAKLSQILRNFISNALKFTERGEVRMSAAPDAEAGAIRFSVADTGIGIAREHLETIFEEFVQVQGPLQRRVKGTGLGLPLCRRLAGLLGGRLEVTSEPGLGSTFAAIVPARYVAPVEPVADASALPSVDPWRIPVLVVEDEPELQLFYDRIFRLTAYQAIPARTLRQAEQALHSAQPAAIVLDIMLKGEDSWHWLGAIKNDPATARIPVVVVTDAAEPRKALALGADAYLAKPIDRAKLLGELNKLMGSRILIIDDDPATRYTLRRLLDNASYRVLEASDGSTGLAAARAARPEVILLDLGLPDLDGMVLLDRLKDDQATRSIPVVVATARDLSAQEEDSLRERAHSVLSKRELNDSVVATVSAALGALASGAQARA